MRQGQGDEVVGARGQGALGGLLWSSDFILKAMGRNKVLYRGNASLALLSPCAIEFCTSKCKQHIKYQHISELLKRCPLFV